MSTTIITQFNQNSKSTDAQSTTTIVHDDCSIEISNAVTQGEGKNKFTDYEVKVKVSF